MRFVGGPMHGRHMAVAPDTRRWEVAEESMAYMTLTEHDSECPANFHTYTHTYHVTVLLSPTDERGIFEKVLLHEQLIPGHRDPEGRAVTRWMELRQPPVVLDGLP